MFIRPIDRLLRAQALAMLLVLGTAANEQAYSQTLKAIEGRGNLVCGVSQGILGFSAKAANADWSGFDVDFCRALAAEIFNDTTKIKFVPLSASERFNVLQSGAIDILSRNSTWTNVARGRPRLGLSGGDLL